MLVSPFFQSRPVHAFVCNLMVCIWDLMVIVPGVRIYAEIRLAYQVKAQRFDTVFYERKISGHANLKM